MSSRSVFTPAEQNRRNILSVHLTLDTIQQKEWTWLVLFGFVVCSIYNEHLCLWKIEANSNDQTWLGTGCSLAGRLQQHDLGIGQISPRLRFTNKYALQLQADYYSLVESLALKTTVHDFDVWMRWIHIGYTHRHSQVKMSSPKRSTNIAILLRLWLLVNYA